MRHMGNCPKYFNGCNLVLYCFSFKKTLRIVEAEIDATVSILNVEDERPTHTHTNIFAGWFRLCVNGNQRPKKVGSAICSVMRPERQGLPSYLVRRNACKYHTFWMQGVCDRPDI